MKHNIYRKLIEHVAKRNWVDANDTFRAILESKVATRLESEKQLLQEPEDDEEEVKEHCGLPHAELEKECSAVPMKVK